MQPLEQFVLESSQYKNDSTQQIIFIFGAHPHTALYIPLDKFNGAFVGLTDQALNRKIFMYYFAGKNEILRLLDNIIIAQKKLEKNMGATLTLYDNDIAEIENLKKEWKKLNDQYCHEDDIYPRQALWTQPKDNLNKAKKEVIELSSKISQLCKSLSEKWAIACSNSSMEDEKSYLHLQYQLYKKLENYFLKHVEMYQKADEYRKYYSIKTEAIKHGKALSKN